MEPGIDLVEMSVHIQVLNVVAEMVLVFFPVVQGTMRAMVPLGLVNLRHSKLIIRSIINFLYCPVLKVST